MNCKDHKEKLISIKTDDGKYCIVCETCLGIAEDRFYEKINS